MRRTMGDTPDDTTAVPPPTADVPRWALEAAAPAEAGGPDALTVAKDLDLLADPPSSVSAGELDAALSGPPPSPRAMRLTRVLGLALVLALGFAGGVLADQNWGQSGGAATASGGRIGAQPEGMPSGMPDLGSADRTGTTGPIGTGATDGTVTTGTVTLVDGSVIYLTDSAGSQLRVEVGDDTEITTASSTTLDTIDEGDTVTVTGTTADDSLTATSVEVTK